MSNINMENLATMRLCLEEMLEEKLELQKENNLQYSVKHSLELTIRDMKNVIEIVDDKLEEYR